MLNRVYVMTGDIFQKHIL